MDVLIPHQGIEGLVRDHMIVVGGGRVPVPDLEGGQDPDQVPGEDLGPVLAPAAATQGLGQDQAAALALDPDQGPDQSLDQDLDQSLQLMTKNQDRDPQVKRNQDRSLPWKLKMKKSGSVQNLAQDHGQSLVLSQDHVHVSARHQEVDLDLRVLSKTVNLSILSAYG